MPRTQIISTNLKPGIYTCNRVSTAQISHDGHEFGSREKLEDLIQKSGEIIRNCAKANDQTPCSEGCAIQIFKNALHSGSIDRE